MTDTTLKIYMAAILLHLGLILMVVSSISNSVHEYSSSMHSPFILFGFFSALIAAALLVWYLVALFSTPEKS